MKSYWQMKMVLMGLAAGWTATVGFAAEDVKVDEAALNDANFGVSLAWSPCPCLTVTPACQYTMLADSDIEAGAAGLYKDKDPSIVSLKATYTF